MWWVLFICYNYYMYFWNSKAVSHSGFTLIELLVVVSIIGLLSSVVLASLSGARERARITRMVSDFRQIETGLTLWMDATGRVQWPEDESFGDGASDARLSEVAAESNLSEYLTVPEPPFGSHYQYDFDPGTGVVTDNCGRPHFGIYISDPNDEVTEEIMQAVDEIIDGEVDLDCGKLRRYVSVAPDIIYYVIGEDEQL